MTAVRGQVARLARVVGELPLTPAARRKANRAARRGAWGLWWESLTVEDVQRLEAVLSRPQDPGELFMEMTVGSLRVALAEWLGSDGRKLLARCTAAGGGPPDVCGEVSDPAADCLEVLQVLYPDTWGVENQETLRQFLAGERDSFGWLTAEDIEAAAKLAGEL